MSGEANEIKVDAATLLKAHYRFQQGCFLSDQQESSGGLFAFSEITPIPMWNHSAWIDDSADFEKFLLNSRDWQSAKNRCPVLYVPGPNGTQLEALKAQGFEKFDGSSARYSSGQWLRKIR